MLKLTFAVLAVTLAGTARAEEETPDDPCGDLVVFLREALTDPDAWKWALGGRGGGGQNAHSRR